MTPLPHPPAPTLAEVEAHYESLIAERKAVAARYALAFGASHSAAERDIALYSLALSCVRAVRAPAYLVVLDKNGEPISTWKRDDRLTVDEQEAKMRAVFNDEDFPHHRPFTLLPLYAFPALPEPPHAE